jgi:hypothetical protein
MFAPLKLAQKIQLGGEDKLRRIAKKIRSRELYYLEYCYRCNVCPALFSVQTMQVSIISLTRKHRNPLQI